MEHDLTELSGEKMDPAETEWMTQALSSQGVLIGRHCTALVKVMKSLQQLSSSINRLNSAFEVIMA